MTKKHHNHNSHSHSHSHSCCNHDHFHSDQSVKAYLAIIISFLILSFGLILDYILKYNYKYEYYRFLVYFISYTPIAIPVFKNAIKTFKNRDFFNEFTLMFIATVGAFIIKEYPEGVAVMLFYTLGELFQDYAIGKANRSIKSLLDLKPNKASVYRDESLVDIDPEKVNIGEKIEVKTGEKVPLDGILLSEFASFNTSAITGESVPKTIFKGESILSGMFPIDKVVKIEVNKKYSDSSLSKILDMVQNAVSRKAKTEILIRKLARIYTPIIFLSAIFISIIPYFILSDYQFDKWFYKSLMFLVISCPCALVISIPLGYFGGIGAASLNGILFKGANFLDIIKNIKVVVLDKTGTLTKGVFNVQKIFSIDNSEKDLLEKVKAIEKKSSHPIAKAIISYGPDTNLLATDIEEFAGIGLRGFVEGEEILAGNQKLMHMFGVDYDNSINSIVDTVLIISINRLYKGYITISDEIKQDSAIAVSELKKQGVKKIIILSGDKQSVTDKIAKQLSIDEAYGDLLPENKVKYLEKFKKENKSPIAFVGDGINDAPVLAISDVGISMGSMGSDIAIEVSDVVIQTDQLSKISTSINIAKSTHLIVYQNIFIAFGIKILVLLLGINNIANLWEAVFADVGVAILAILNAMRIIKKKF